VTERSRQHRGWRNGDRGSVVRGAAGNRYIFISPANETEECVSRNARNKRWLAGSSRKATIINRKQDKCDQLNFKNKNKKIATCCNSLRDLRQFPSAVI
jgi:hypothetical protein